MQDITVAAIGRLDLKSKHYSETWELNVLILIAKFYTNYGMASNI
jgi:hypothetical protein